MRLLFSSDLHDFTAAYRRFAALLAAGPWDAAVLAGDLIDERSLPDGLLLELTAATADDILLELPGPGDPEPWKTRIRQREVWNRRGLQAIEDRFRGILESARKPVFLIPGNHDGTPWADSAWIRNIHGRRIDFMGWNLVGWRWTPPFDAIAPADLAAGLGALEPLVDRRSILVTHDAPRGVLDLVQGEHAGSRDIAALVGRRQPRWHLFGHVHHQFGRQGRSVNGSFPQARAFWDIEVGPRRCTPVPSGLELAAMGGIPQGTG